MSIQPIGPTPADENCEQYGVPGYDPIKARKECCAFLHQLRRMHGTEPDGARLIVSTADGYPEVAVKFPLAVILLKDTFEVVKTF